MIKSQVMYEEKWYMILCCKIVCYNICCSKNYWDLFKSFEQIDTKQVLKADYKIWMYHKDSFYKIQTYA